MKKSTKCTYIEFLERLIYSIDHVDWENHGKVVNMMKLLTSLEKQPTEWPSEVEEYQRQVDEAIDCFEKGRLSDYELMKELTRIKNSLK